MFEKVDELETDTPALKTSGMLKPALNETSVANSEVSVEFEFSERDKRLRARCIREIVQLPWVSSPVVIVAELLPVTLPLVVVVSSCWVSHWGSPE